MAAPLPTMLNSAAYCRMRSENPEEFVPKSVFFTCAWGSESDRANSFWVKAALVYESITGQHVNDETKPVANKLLLSLAKRCSQRKSDATALAKETEASSGDHADEKNEQSTQGGKTTQHSDEGGSGDHVDEKTEQSTQGGKTTQHPDEGSDENKKFIDGIFLVVGFLSRIKKVMGKSNSRDAVDESFKSTHMQDIVTDVIKLENQLPLEDLLDVVDHVEESFKETLKTDENLKKHLKKEKYELGFNRDNFHEVIDCFCWYYSPFFKKKPSAQQDSQFKKVADKDSKMQERTLLDFLHDSLVLPKSVRTGAGGDTAGKTFSMPTARELRRSGVRFVADEDGRAVIVFKEHLSSLSLPALVYDFKLATVARNLLAWEYEEQSKPVTRYFQMMNELVEEVADVRILRRAGVVRGGSKGAKEVHELIKKIDGHATYPSVFVAMDLQIGQVKQFHDKRMKNFLVRYRPGVIWATSLAAVSVVAVIAARKKRA